MHKLKMRSPVFEKMIIISNVNPDLNPGQLGIRLLGLVVTGKQIESVRYQIKNGSTMNTQ